MTKRASVPLFYDFRYPRNSSISLIKERKTHASFDEKMLSLRLSIFFKKFEFDTLWVHHSIPA